MLAVEDYIDALEWAQVHRRLDGLVAKADANAKVIHDWVGQDALDRQPRQGAGDRLQHQRLPRRSPIPTWWPRVPRRVAQVAKGIAAALEKEGVAFDIGAYRDAPPGLRIWCGATVEASDLEALTPWLDWAFAQEKAKLAKAA